MDCAFVPPSIYPDRLLAGQSYSHFSAVPDHIATNSEVECTLGIDEAGRGPVLGPMVYAVYYLPTTLHRSLLAEVHRFDDSKVLTPAVRSELMNVLCTPKTDLYEYCGWATRVMSARDISRDQMRPAASSNLNAQAMAATIQLIQDVLKSGVKVKEIYIDTIGPPATYQRKLELIFPAINITVAKKADSLYPCVSAASVCAKVTRDTALDVLYRAYNSKRANQEEAPWGSGYPSDARCVTWLKQHMHPVFGWGNECRFSWGTAKELLEAKGAPCNVEWTKDPDDSSNMILSTMLARSGDSSSKDDGLDHGLQTWFGSVPSKSDICTAV